MKKSLTAVLAFVLIVGFATLAHAGLDDFLLRLNDKALSDANRFNAQISAQFGIPIPKVEAVVKVMPSPADAFMVFQLGHMTSKPPETVVRTFDKHKGQGWGVIAKDLGIKPGSREFHQLKRGDFALTGQPVSGGSNHGNGEGKKLKHGKGHGKGKGYDD